MDESISQNRRTLAILTYHSIGDPGDGGKNTRFHTAEALFVEHLTYLRDSDWQVIGDAELLQGMRLPESLPVRSVLLTFDDAYVSMREIALPWLQHFGFPAVLFVPTDVVDRSNRFETATSTRISTMCDWNDLSALSLAGISVQSHGCSHRSFFNLTIREQREEFVQSKHVLEARLGSRVNLFAYPYGEVGWWQDTFERELSAQGCEVAFVCGDRLLSLPPWNPYRLPRFVIGADTDLEALLQRTLMIAGLIGGSQAQSQYRDA